MPYKRMGPLDPYQEFSKQWGENDTKSKIYAVGLYPEVMERITRYAGMPVGGKIVEAGCGLAGWVVVLHKSGYDIVGVDFVAEALEAARAYQNNIPLAAMDCTCLGFRENSFDLYLSLGVIEHLEAGPTAFLTEAFRILKPSGIGIISVPNHDCCMHIDHVNPPQHQAFFEYQYSVNEYQEIIKEHGFEVLEHFFYGFFSYLHRKRYLRAPWDKRPGALNFVGRLWLERLRRSPAAWKYGPMQAVVVKPKK